MAVRFHFSKNIVVGRAPAGGQLPDARRALPDPSGVHVSTSQKIVVNGREYASVEDMPADDRKLYELAMGSSSTQGAPRRASALGRTALTALTVALLGLLAIALLYVLRR